ncbi:MAG TPA: sugar transferase [Pseudolabrys sp.]|nr:sugar transferase [Pseudolabrys sp.]
MRNRPKISHIQAKLADEPLRLVRAGGITRPHHSGKYDTVDRRIAFGADDTQGAHFFFRSTPADIVNSRVKRSFDVIIGALSLILLLPVFLVAAAAIKLTSRGPVLFVQQRYGLNNNLFMIYKFRTMYIDQCDQTGVEQARKADQRITPIGRFLRRYSIDELPQLINVVKGDMSLVGPRPHVPNMLAAGLPYELLVPNYFERHRVRPGLSGLAQAKGFRGCTDDAKQAKTRIDLDLQYIQNWSFGLDLRIILETLRTQLVRSRDDI